MIDLGKGSRIDRVDPSGAAHCDVREAVLSKDLQVLRYGGLPDPEIPTDDLDNLSRGMFTVTESLQDAPSDRISKDFERMHHEPV